MSYHFIIEDVFRLTGRGTAIVGRAPTAGEFTSGETVEILRNGTVVFESEAFFEIHVSPGTVSLVLPPIDADVQRGDEVRAKST